MADDKTVCCPHVSRSTHDSMGVICFFKFLFAFGSPRLARCNYQVDVLCGWVWVWGKVANTPPEILFFPEISRECGSKG